MSEISEAAIERSDQLMEAENPHNFRSSAATFYAKAFARYIQEVSDAAKAVCDYEASDFTDKKLTPFILPDPVDPLLIEARRLWAAEAPDFYYEGCCYKAASSGPGFDLIIAGKLDSRPPVQRYVVALKRGMELAK